MESAEAERQIGAVRELHMKTLACSLLAVAVGTFVRIAGISEEAGKAMQEIVNSVQRVGDIIGEITAASSEQSSGISQVNQAVGDIDRMTQQNAALVEDSAAAAQSLREQAARLAEVVSQFRLADNAGLMQAAVGYKKY